ncbi:MAG: hypothetical protein Q8Q42_03380 [Nanoarchaeota archaeon]|nr:hypothetical protein [Nanoarchaeota archaeon]
MAGSGTGTPITSPAPSMEGLPYFEAVWVSDNSASSYVNNTLASQTISGTTFTIFEDSADYLYLGSSSRFDLAAFILATAGTVGTRTYAFSRSDNSWSQFIPGGTYDFTISGGESYTNLRNWTARAFSATSPHAYTPPDTAIRYWIRISVASVSTPPTVNQIMSRPYAAYCTASDVANQLQLPFDFDETTNPTRNTVEDYIHQAQSIIDYKTWMSWRLNYVEDEEYQFNMAGFKLKHRDIVAICKMEVWNGGGYETKTQGRTGDYFVVQELGLIKFSRFFMLPARFTSGNSPTGRWGWGEFEFPCRLSYLYGSSTFTDALRGGMVFDICKKMAASDVYLNHDYTILSASGVDRVSLDRKIEDWRTEIEEKLSSLQSWQVF